MEGSVGNGFAIPVDTAKSVIAQFRAMPMLEDESTQIKDECLRRPTICAAASSMMTTSLLSSHFHGDVCAVHS
jgi:S1-C subfamily serine protease